MRLNAHCSRGQRRVAQAASAPKPTFPSVAVRPTDGYSESHYLGWTARPFHLSLSVVEAFLLTSLFYRTALLECGNLHSLSSKNQPVGIDGDNPVFYIVGFCPWAEYEDLTTPISQ